MNNKKKKSIYDIIRERNEIIRSSISNEYMPLPVKRGKEKEEGKTQEGINILFPKKSGLSTYSEYSPLDLIRENNEKSTHVKEWKRKAKKEAEINNLNLVITSGSAKDNYEKFAKADSKFEQESKKGEEIYKKQGLDKGTEDSAWLNRITEKARGSEYWWETLNKSLSPDEKKVAMYYYKKGGYPELDKYLKSFQSRLEEEKEQRKIKMADEFAKEAKDNPMVNVITAPVMGIEDSVKNTGLFFRRGFGNNEIPALTPYEMSKEKRQENMGKAERVISDIGYSAGNMIPAIIAGSANPVLGAATTGISSAGGAYADTVRQGKSDSDAWNYAIINGALEGGLQYLLGGIKNVSKGGLSKILGKTSAGQNVLKKIGNVSNRLIKNEKVKNLLKVSGKQIAQLGDEAFEEYLQANIDPVVRNIMLDENNEIKPFSEDKLYSAALGALSAGLMNLPSNAVEIGANIKSSSPKNKPDTRIFNEKAVKNAKKIKDITPTIDDVSPQLNVQNDPEPISFNNIVTKNYNNVKSNSKSKNKSPFAVIANPNEILKGLPIIKNGKIADINESNIFENQNLNEQADLYTKSQKNKGFGEFFDINKNSVNYKLLKNQDKIKQLDIISEIKGDEFNISDKDYKAKILDFFNSFGNKIKRDDIGEIIFNKKGFKNSISHGVGKNKIASFKAVPDTIKKGVIIDETRNWKGRGYDSAIIAAPIKIKGHDYLQGVVVNKLNDGTNRYYLHEVVECPLYNKKTDTLNIPQNLTLVVENKLRGLDTNNKVSFNNIITKNYNNVKGKSKNKSPFAVIANTNEILKSLPIIKNGKIVDTNRSNIFRNNFISTAKEINRRVRQKNELYKLPKVKSFDNVISNELQVPIFKNGKEKAEYLLEKYKELSKLKKAERKLYYKEAPNETEKNRLKALMVSKMDASSLKNIDGIDIKKISRLYDAYMERKIVEDEISAINEQNVKKNINLAESILENSDDFKEKRIPGSYKFDTIYRNARDVFKNEDVLKKFVDNYITPNNKANANIEKFLNGVYDIYKKIDIDGTKKRKISYVVDGKKQVQNVSEKNAVFFIHEAEYDRKMMKKSKKPMNQHEAKAFNEEMAILNAYYKAFSPEELANIRKKGYEVQKLFNSIGNLVNKSLVLNGFEPIKFRKNYIHHYSDDYLRVNGKNPFTKALSKSINKVMDFLEINISRDKIPTEIKGLTEDFSPRKKWAPFMMERTGKKTDYDLEKSISRYADVAAEVIYRTDVIGRYRALEKEIRKKYSDEGTKLEIEKIENSGLSQTEKENKFNELFDKIEERKTFLGNFADYLHQYTNILAGKKSSGDRELERSIGRVVYSASNELSKNIAANMVGFKLSSAITNISTTFPALLSEVKNKYVMKAIKDTSVDLFKKNSDGFAQKSDFLTSRKGHKKIYNTKRDKMNEAAMLFMSLSDDFSSQITVRARYYQNLDKGMSPQQAMKEADLFSINLMADRSKGNKPLIFENKKLAPFTMFQLEVNNKLKHIFKDVPYYAKSDSKIKSEMIKKTSAIMMKMFFLTFIADDMYEYLTGRSAEFNPIRYFNNFIGDNTGYKMPHLMDIAEGLKDGKSLPEIFKTEQKRKKGAVVKDIVQDMPFVGGVLGGGRIPITQGIPDIKNIIDKTESDGLEGFLEESGKQALKTVKNYILPPGSNQLQKTIEGIKTVAEGGSYKYDKNGNKILEWPVLSENSLENAGKYTKAALFGKYSLKEAQDYVASGFNKFSAKQTRLYEKIIQLNKLSKKDAKEVVENTKTNSIKTFYNSLLNTDMPEKEINEFVINAGMKENKMYNSLLKNKNLNREQMKNVSEYILKHSISNSKKINYILNYGNEEQILNFIEKNYEKKKDYVSESENANESENTSDEKQQAEEKNVKKYTYKNYFSKPVALPIYK